MVWAIGVCRSILSYSSERPCWGCSSIGFVWGVLLWFRQEGLVLSMGVFGSADAGPAQPAASAGGAQPAASAGGSAPTCSRFWNSGPVLRRGRAIRGWQDLRAVHDLRASDGESAPWRQGVRAVYSPTALCGAFWMHSTHILPKLAESEYMAAICCHELVFFPSDAPSGTHRGAILPRPAARERIGAISCHGHAPDDRHRSSSTAYLRL